MPRPIQAQVRSAPLLPVPVRGSACAARAVAVGGTAVASAVLVAATVPVADGTGVVVMVAVATGVLEGTVVGVDVASGDGVAVGPSCARARSIPLPFQRSRRPATTTAAIPVIHKILFNSRKRQLLSSGGRFHPGPAVVPTLDRLRRKAQPLVPLPILPRPALPASKPTPYTGESPFPEDALVRAGIINVTGYIGAEAARLLHAHPDFELVSVTGRSAAGKPLAEVFPHLAPLGLTITTELDDVDVVFSALPHGASAEVLLPYIRAGIPVFDQSADFRLKDAAEYESWYRVAHPAPDLLPAAVYGLPELHRPDLRDARLVAVPGCYPTGAILALAPLFREGVAADGAIVDAKSGISGAGRAPAQQYHFAEAEGGVSAYGLDGHRHQPEITQELALLREGPRPKITFVPHLIPMSRGILTTAYVPLAEGRLASGREKQEVRDLYGEFYRDEPFVSIVPAPPQTKQVAGSNRILIYPTVDVAAGRAVVVAAHDNLVKGGAGQGIQCMNIALGFPETAGLSSLGLFP